MLEFIAELLFEVVLQVFGELVFEGGCVRSAQPAGRAEQ